VLSQPSRDEHGVGFEVGQCFRSRPGVLKIGEDRLHVGLPGGAPSQAMDVPTLFKNCAVALPTIPLTPATNAVFAIMLLRSWDRTAARLTANPYHW
jgi:hypothetical protein